MSKQEDYVWEDIWRGDCYRDPAERERRAAKRVSAFAGLLGDGRDLGDVIEIGCGDGSLANAFYAHPSWSIQSYRGFDRSETAINAARLRCASNLNARFDVADITELSHIGGVADTVIACGLIEHIRDEQEALSVIRSLCRSTGRVLITTSNTFSLMYVNRLARELFGTWQYGYQKNHSTRSLCDAMSPYFNIERSGVVHGDWDLIGSALADRAMSAFFPNAGRYVFVLATPKHSS